MTLHDRIAARNPHGITLEDAHQLCLWTFCTLDVLPPELRAEPLDRATLAKIFSRLARRGYVDSPDPAITSPSYWDSLISQLLTQSRELDRDFRTRIPSLL